MDTNTTPAPTTNDILSAFLDSSAPISKVADQLRMSVEDLAAWLANRAPLLRTLTDVVEHRVRFKVFSAELVAVDSLKAIAEADRDPERRRKASTKLLCHAAIFRRPTPRQTAGRGSDPTKPDPLRTPRDHEPTSSPPPTAAARISPKPISPDSRPAAPAPKASVAIAPSVAITPTRAVSPVTPRDLPTERAAPQPPQPPVLPQPPDRAPNSSATPTSQPHAGPASPPAPIVPNAPTSPPAPAASPQPAPKPANDPKWPLRPPLHTTRW